MKIQATSEHAVIYLNAFNESSGDTNESRLEALQAVFNSLEIPEPLPNQGWISGRERLPTEEDAGADGDVVVMEDGVMWSRESNLVDQNQFWLPFPKNLKHPKPQDPFEAWWEENKEYLLHLEPEHIEDVKLHAKEAYDLGKQSK